MGLQILYPVLHPAGETGAAVAARSGMCALTVMAKAPRPGSVKTRLSPPLTLQQAAELNVCFLRDTTENIATVVASEAGAGSCRTVGLVSYTPVGDEGLFEGLLPDGFALVAQRGEGFGERLLSAAQDILACGFGSVCLIDSDSPTVPRTAFEQAVAELARPGDRVVLGPTADGGYYLIGMKRPHAAVFERIAWSTETVYAETCERARAAGIELVDLPLWYDVDDAATLKILQAELLAGMMPGFAVVAGYPAQHTRTMLMKMDWALDADKRLVPDAGGAAGAAVDQHEQPGLSIGDSEGGRRVMASSIAVAEPKLAARRHWAEARPWQTNAVLLMIGVAMFLLAQQLISESHHFTIGFSGVSGWGATLYVVACWLVLTQPVDRWTLPIILTVAVACRLVPLFHAPFLSTDVYRYAWDGIVQHAHISPFRYVPGDPALTFLRAPNQNVFDNINRRDYAPTVYPPMAQMIFYAATWFSPTATAIKTAMVLFEGVTVWAQLALLRELGLRPAQASLLYAWCPVLIWEIAGSGHLDSAAMAFIALALLARYKKQAWLTGLWLGIAVMIKFYPLVLLPALLWRGGGRGGTAANGSAWKIPTAVAGVVAFGYACYASVGMRVFGFLGGYVQEEGMDTGARYFLLDLARRIPGMRELPIWAFYAVCAAVFAGLMAWTWRTARQPDSARDGFLAPAFALAVAVTLLFSPHYGWYVIWLVPFFAVMPNLPMLVYLMGFFYGYTTWWADPGPKMFLLNEYLYGATAVATAIWILMLKWPVHRAHFAPSKLT